MKSINQSEFDYCNVNINHSWWIQCQVYEKSHKMVGGPVLLMTMMMMSYNGWRYFPLALSPMLSSSITCCNCRSNPQNEPSSSRRMQQSRKVIISISMRKAQSFTARLCQRLVILGLCCCCKLINNISWVANAEIRQWLRCACVWAYTRKRKWECCVLSWAESVSDGTRSNNTVHTALILFKVMFAFCCQHVNVRNTHTHTHRPIKMQTHITTSLHTMQCNAMPNAA